MSTTSTGGQQAPVHPLAAARAGAAAASSRAGASRCPQTSTAPVSSRAAGRPRGRRSAGRPPACRRSRAPRRSRSAPGRQPARRPPSAGRRRSAPRRSAAAAIRRSGRPAGIREWSSATRSPKRRRKRSIGLRGQGDLGDEHDRAPAPLQRLAGRLQVDLGLARAGDPVEQERAGVAGSRRLRLRCRQGLGDRRHRPALVGRQPDAVADGSHRRRGGPPPPLDLRV